MFTSVYIDLQCLIWPIVSSSEEVKKGPNVDQQSLIVCLEAIKLLA